MIAPPKPLLVFGYGNPGRLDDGLGPAFAQAVAALHLPGVDTEADYQLTIEDAQLIARYPSVLFADATVSGTDTWYCRPVEPAEAIGYTSHHVEPAQVLALARRLFQAPTQAWVLGIRGFTFDAFGENLSTGARANLQDALSYIQRTLAEPATASPGSTTSWR